MTVDPVLNVRDLRHGYAGQAVLDGFGLSLRAGEHKLLLGPSGSGKTTLVNVITGLCTPDAGEVRVCGESMSAAGGAQRDDLRRRRIGLVFQTLRLVSALSLRANLRLAQRLAGQPNAPAAVDRLIEAVGLGSRADAKPRELSQGEMQRGAIARALVGKPALLIADEPTSALDDANADRIARLLMDAAAENGSTLLVATHDVRLKRHIADAVELTPLRAAA